MLQLNQKHQEHQQQQQQHQMSNTEKNVIKTTIMVIVGYLVFWFPTEILHMILYYTAIKIDTVVYSLTSVIAFVSLLLNPVIYSTHFNVVRRIFAAVVKPAAGDANTGSSGAELARMSSLRNRFTGATDADRR